MADINDPNRVVVDNRTEGGVTEELGATGQRVGGNIQSAAGAITGDASMQAAGSANINQGAARQGSNHVFGTFRDRESAERAYSTLSTRGYGRDDINLVMSDETRGRYFGDSSPEGGELGSKALEGAGAGSAIGGTLGAIIGGIAAIGTNVLLPGVGLIVAGPLAAALAGAGAGGLTGGLLGALVGSGIPEEDAAHYERNVKEGNIVMGFNARNDEDRQFFQNEFGSGSTR